MDPHIPFDLVGLYITDDFIDVVCGYEKWAGNVVPIHAAAIMTSEEVRHRFFFKESIPQTFREVALWISRLAPRVRVIGVGCYGPFASLDHGSRQSSNVYGLLQPSKRGRLSGLSVRELLLDALDVQLAPDIVVETDVNVAALGELYLRRARSGTNDWGDKVIAFIKVSHGIGGGVVFGSRFWAGRLHPEMGHIQVRRWPKDLGRWQRLLGTCDHHRDCLQGLANVASFEQRWKRSFEELLRDPEHEAWQREAFYIAQLCIAVTALLAPSQIILGGRVMNMDTLIDLVRQQFTIMLADADGNYHPGYSDILESDFIDTVGKDISNQIRRPGVYGALCLAALMARPNANVADFLPRTAGA